MQRRGTGRAWGQCSHSRAQCRLFCLQHVPMGRARAWWTPPSRGPRHAGTHAHMHTCTGTGRQLHGRARVGWDSSSEAAQGRDVAAGVQHRGQARARPCNVVGWRARGRTGGQGSLSAQHAKAPAGPSVIGRPWGSPPILILQSCLPVLRFPPGSDGFWMAICRRSERALLCDAGGDGLTGASPCSAMLCPGKPWQPWPRAARLSIHCAPGRDAVVEVVWARHRWDGAVLYHSMQSTPTNARRNRYGRWWRGRGVIADGIGGSPERTRLSEWAGLNARNASYGNLVF